MSYIASKWIFFITLLPSFCRGAAVELIMTPSVVTIGESLTLCCSAAQNKSQFASFNFVNWTRIGFAKLVDGICIPTVLSTGEVCDQLCSCDTNGKSFSWVIPEVSEDLINTQILCYMATPDVQTSDIITVLSQPAQPAMTGLIDKYEEISSTNTQPTGPETNPSTNVGVIGAIAATMVLTIVAVVVFYYRRNKMASNTSNLANTMAAKPDNDDNRKRRQSQEYEDLNLADVANSSEYEDIRDKGDNKEDLQSQQYEDLNLADVANSAEYEDIRDNKHRTPCSDCEGNAYESLRRMSSPNEYDELQDRKVI